jgi:hypothetical protein
MFGMVRQSPLRAIRWVSARGFAGRGVAVDRRGLVNAPPAAMDESPLMADLRAIIQTRGPITVHAA